MPLIAKSTGILQQPISSVEVFCQRVKIIKNGCWEWQGYISKNGYGQFPVRGATKNAHRVMWELMGNIVDPKLQLDHLCRNRSCVNPIHLEQVASAINTYRGEGISAQNKVKSYCNKGHSLSGENLWIKKRYDYHGKTQRLCRECQLNSVRRHRAKLSSAELVGDQSMVN